ncbi:MAG TPA: M48 family metallopeptidase [Burkholderiales bacterium]|nr:M48 family metallopeptidase [Burkholderiales bacterium]
MKKLITAGLILITLSIAGCQTSPVTGRSQLMLVSEGSAIAASSNAYTEMLKPLQEKGQIDNDPAVTRRVRDITERLIPHAIAYRPETEKWEWNVAVIDDPETVNAWAMAGGKMAIYTGLIEQLEATDDEIAQVMGHEIAHALLKHTAERMSRAIAMQLGLGIFAVTQRDSKHGGMALQGAALAAAVALELPNSRQAETESDRVGLELAAQAGDDPHAAVTLWQKMGKVGGGGPPQFLSTHPSPDRRTETLSALVPQMMPFYQDKSPRPTYDLAAGQLRPAR